MDVDVDDMRPEVVKYVAQYIKPHDVTSNNIIVHQQMLAPENKGIFDKAVQEYGSQGWSRVRDRLSAQFAALLIPYISGRVLVQVSPAFAYNTLAVYEHAKSYAAEFNKVGMSNDRFCIKIPTTGPAMIAAKKLNAEGIRTLGTCLFGLPQALAAGQANCLYISPYFNEVRAHADHRLWCGDVEDPATQHPMSARMVQMINAYRTIEAETGRTQPMIKSASFINAKEAIANGEMGCQGGTPLEPVLKELCETPAPEDLRDLSGSYKPSPYIYKNVTGGAAPSRLAKLAMKDPLALAEMDGKIADYNTDYLANHGQALEDAINADPATKSRLRDALELFIGFEMKSRDLIEEAIAAAGICTPSPRK